MNFREIGTLGEEIAEKYLKEQGYKIIEKNYHASRLSEIDIIARHNKLLVFVEVKLRTNLSRGYGREAVTKKKQENIRYGAQHYMYCKLKKEENCRFDVLEITMLEGEPQIRLIENAF
jgi:putative endonuclease